MSTLSKKAWVSLVVVVLVVVGIILFGGTKAESDTITIGVIGPLTGNGASYGEPRAQTIAMAVDEINAAGGIDGRKLVVIEEDGKCNGTDAANAMRKLANVDKVKIVMGGFCSGESIAAEPIATEAKILLISDGSTSPDLTDVSAYFVRLYPTADKQSELLAQLSMDKGWETVGVMQEQTEYAAGLARSFVDSFTVMGGTVIEETFATEGTDFRTVLTKVKGESPDAIFFAVQTPATGEKILANLADLGWQPNMLLNNVMAGSPETIAEYATLLEGALGAHVGLRGDENFEAFLAKFVARYNVEPAHESYMAAGYDTLWLLKEAIEEVGESPEAISQWFRDIQDRQGASGIITLQQNGDRASGYMLAQVKGGEVVPYED